MATGPYGGELLFVIQKDPEVVKEGQVDGEGFELRCTPAPVKWVSQFPAEEEYLWPTHTVLIPKLPRHRQGDVCHDKEVYEFTPAYLWDTRSQSVGRIEDIEEDERQMARMTVTLASQGLGMQDAFMSLQGIFVDGEVEDDLGVEQALSIAFAVFDRKTCGTVVLDDVEGLLRFFHNSLFGVEGSELDALCERVLDQMRPLVRENDHRLHWSDFLAHFTTRDYALI